MADPAPPAPAQQTQEPKQADPAPPAPAQQTQEPKQTEPAPVASEVKAETPAEPENKEVPTPEPTPVPESQPVQSSASIVAPATLAAAALVAAPAAASAAAPVAAAAVSPAAVLAAALVMGPATATALAQDPSEEAKAESAAGDNAPKEEKKETNWQQRELELLKKIDELEKVKNQRSEDGLKLELKIREEEIDLLKARVKNLETELQAALSKPSAGKNHEMIENIKQQHEELLSKARGMIFDKTKMVKNQELQIEALTTQVQSLKDINLITKDLLEIRNSEVKAMEDRFQAMEARFKAEKERYGLVLERAQTSTTINDDLRKEYETQLGIFKELREKYELRVQALVAENAKLKELNLQLKGGPSG